MASIQSSIKNKVGLNVNNVLLGEMSLSGCNKVAIILYFYTPTNTIIYIKDQIFNRNYPELKYVLRIIQHCMKGLFDHDLGIN